MLIAELHYSQNLMWVRGENDRLGEGVAAAVIIAIGPAICLFCEQIAMPCQSTQFIN
jgi:hypothetical protein